MFFSVNQFHNTSPHTQESTSMKTKNHIKYICSIVCKVVVQQIIMEKFQNSEYFVMVVVGSWSRTERIYPLYNITRLDGLRQMRADYKKFDTTWEQRSKKKFCLTSQKVLLFHQNFWCATKRSKKIHIFQNKNSMKTLVSFTISLEKIPNSTNII